MDYIKKNKLLIAVVIILVILNVGAISFILLAPRPPKPGTKPRDMASRFIQDELGLTTEQKIRYEDLREAHFKTGDSLMHVRREKIEEFFDLLRKDEVSKDELRQKASPLGDLEIERSLKTFEHFRALRALLTPDQRKKFDSILDDVTMPREPGWAPGVPGPGRPGSGRPGPDGEAGGRPEFGGPGQGEPPGPEGPEPGGPPPENHPPELVD